jgi:hypothetical protein
MSFWIRVSGMVGSQREGKSEKNKRKIIKKKIKLNLALLLQFLEFEEAKRHREVCDA